MRREDLSNPHMSPVLRLPLVERRTADPVPPADLGCRHACFLLLHDRGDLLI